MVRVLCVGDANEREKLGRTWPRVATALLAVTGMPVTSALAQDKTALGAGPLPPADTRTMTAQVEPVVGLPEIVIDATSAQSPVGPGVGYVATRSVSGTKTDTPLIETPQSISVVTQKQIEQQQPQTAAEAFRYTTGVAAEAGGVATRYTDYYIFLRGFRADVYRDSLKELPLLSEDPYLLQRAEVIHGPASVLYGQASPGGLVDLVSKRPTETPVNEVVIQGGSYNLVKGAFDLGGPADKDGHFLYRLTGVAYGSDAQTIFTDIRRVAIAPAFTYAPDGATTFTFLSNYTNDPALGPYAGLPAVGTVLSNPYGQLSRSLFIGDPSFNLWKREQAAVGYAFEHRFNEAVSIRQNVRYTDASTLENHLYGATLSPDDMNLIRTTFYDAIRRDGVAVDTQLQANFATGAISHVGLLGVDYQHLKQAEITAASLSLPLNLYAPVYFQPIVPPSTTATFTGNLALRPTTIQDQIGVYAQDQAKFGHLSLLASVREDAAKSDVDESINDVHNRQDDHYATYRIGLIYNFDNGLAPYGNYSTSFQPSVPGTTVNAQVFKPTTGQEGEVGIKYQIAPETLLTFAAYQLTQQNVVQSDPNNPQFSIQTGEIRSKGLEFEARSNITKGFSVIASASYIDNRVTKATDPTIVGKHPVQIPNSTAGIFADYTVHGGTLDGFGLGGGARYTGRSYGTASNEWGVPGFEDASSKLPDFVLFDAVVHYDFSKNWHLQFNAANVFDTKYVSSCVAASTCYFGPSRMLLATARYTW